MVSQLVSRREQRQNGNDRSAIVSRSQLNANHASQMMADKFSADLRLHSNALACKRCALGAYTHPSFTCSVEIHHNQHRARGTGPERKIRWRYARFNRPEIRIISANAHIDAMFVGVSRVNPYGETVRETADLSPHGRHGLRPGRCSTGASRNHRCQYQSVHDFSIHRSL